MSTKIETQYFELYVGGKRVDEEWLELIQEIVYEDASTGSDLLSITISDPYLDVLNSKQIFVEEQSVVFIGGYAHDPRQMFSGYISVIDIDFPESGEPSVAIHCMDNTHLMNREKKKRSWTNKKVSAVAKEIFTSYGFASVVDDTMFTEETISQSDQTNIEFLSNLAGDLDDSFLIYMEGNTAYFVRKEVVEQPQATLTYRDKGFKLISFSPRITKENKKEKVEKSDVNAGSGSVDTGQATESIARDIAGDPVQSTSDKSQANGGGGSSSSGGNDYVYSNGTWTKK